MIALALLDICPVSSLLPFFHRRYLCSGCDEVFVVQMSQRAGFSSFLQKLQSSESLHVVVTPVPEEVFNTAQRISITQNSSICTTNVNMISGLGGAGSSRVSADLCLSSQTYHFPPDLFKETKEFLDSTGCQLFTKAVGAGLTAADTPAAIWRWGGQGRGGMGGARDSLIKSDIDLFVIVRVTVRVTIVGGQKRQELAC